jgi:hypothetical protein
MDPLGNLDTPSIKTMQSLGVRTARVRIVWANVEPKDMNPPSYNWDFYDSVFRDMNTAGIHPTVAFDGCPDWACGSVNGPIDKTSPSRFAALVHAFALHFSDAPYGVQYYEFFNEPDSTYTSSHNFGWGMHGDLYAALLKATVPGLKAINPQARVMTGGLGADAYMDEQPPGPFNRNFLRDVAAAGGGAYLDYINIHYYPQNPHWPTLAAKISDLGARARGYGLNQPFVCTETGLTSSTDPRWQSPYWGPNSEDMQSRYLARTFVESFAFGLAHIDWFTYRDWTDNYPDLAIFFETGLVRKDNSLKPAAGAYRTLAAQVGDQPFVRKLDGPALGTGGVTGYAFGRAGGTQTWVVWSNDNTARTVVPAEVTFNAAVDMYGTPTGSKGRVSVGPNPVYLAVSNAP